MRNTASFHLTTLPFTLCISLCLFFWTAARVDAAVVVNEIAWMGTSESQYGEWLELYNDGEAPVSLSGWKLFENGSTLVFTFTKSIAAGGYLLLERTTPSVPDPVPGISDEAGSFGGSGLANTGENLTLVDSEGTTVQTLSYLGGWPAGDATTKETMQRSGSGWITAPATPGAASQEGTSEGENTPLEEVDENPIPAVSPNKPVIIFTTPPVVFKGVPALFQADPVLEYNFHMTTGLFYWNMGDGAVFRQTTLTPLSYTYVYPGTYTLYVAYYKKESDPYPVLEASKTVEVTIPTLTLRLVDGKAIEIKNSTAKMVNLTNWTLEVGHAKTPFPAMTYLAPNATTTISFAAVSVPPSEEVALMDPSGTVVAHTASPSSGSTVFREHTGAAPVQNTLANVSVEENVPLLSRTASDTPNPPQKQSRASTVVYGALIAICLTLFILLERFMAQRE